MTVNGASASGSYVDCAALSGSQAAFHVTSTTPNAFVHPVVFQDLNSNNRLDGSEPWGIGGEVRFLPAEAASGSRSVTVAAVSVARDYFTDASANATYRYDSNDTFQRSGAAISLAQFEQLISRGDTLSVTYQADERGSVDVQHHQRPGTRSAVRGRAASTAGTRVRHRMTSACGSPSRPRMSTMLDTASSAHRLGRHRL